MTILDKLADLARKRVLAGQAEIPEAALREQARMLCRGKGESLGLLAVKRFNRILHQ